jgi:hypothetical protein
VTTFGRGNHAISTSRWRYIQYFDGSAELYDRSHDPEEWSNLDGHPEYRGLVEEFRSKVPKEGLWSRFVRYGEFKAVIPADGSPMLLFNHGIENHLEERFDESANYPEVVAKIEAWLNEHPSSSRRIVIPEPN